MSAVHPRPKPRPNSRALLPIEIAQFGADAEVCPETGFVFERGSGALTKPEQTAMFRRQLADPNWVADYMRSDPMARIRHPQLFEASK
jgi:hypothetical protein